MGMGMGMGKVVLWKSCQVVRLLDGRVFMRRRRRRRRRECGGGRIQIISNGTRATID